MLIAPIQMEFHFAVGRGRPVVHGQREVEGIGGQFWYEAAGAI